MAINIKNPIDQELPPFVFANSPPAIFSAFYPICANNENLVQEPNAVGIRDKNSAFFHCSDQIEKMPASDHWPYIFECFNKRWIEDAQNLQIGKSCRSQSSTPAFEHIGALSSRHSAPIFDHSNSSSGNLCDSKDVRDSSSSASTTANSTLNSSFQSSPALPGNIPSAAMVGVMNEQMGVSRPVFRMPGMTVDGQIPLLVNGLTGRNRYMTPLEASMIIQQQQQQPRHTGQQRHATYQQQLHAAMFLQNQRMQKASPSVLDSFLSDSRVLDEFRAGRLPNLQLRDLVNHVMEFAQDQYGSRFIQQRLQYATELERQMVFNEILPSIHLLTVNVFGNYVVQKFFELGTDEQKRHMLEQMHGKILNLTVNMYGCRVVQKALERSDREGQRMIANELTGHILRCVKDQNGNHVVQKVIETLDAVQLAFVVTALAGQIVALSTHSYGCRVIQRILERCSETETLVILNELIENFQILVIDQYGNYVVQHILQHGNQENRSRIIQTVRTDMIRLSQHKFASNVVEKCVQFATTEERRFLIADILDKTSSSNVANCPLLLMMKDQYANYVVQKMLELAEPVQRKEMLYLIRYHMPTLKRYTYGKHILAKLEKYLQKTHVSTSVFSPSQMIDIDGRLNGTNAAAGMSNLFF